MKLNKVLEKEPKIMFNLESPTKFKINSFLEKNPSLNVDDSNDEKL